MNLVVGKFYVLLGLSRFQESTRKGERLKTPARGVEVFSSVLIYFIAKVFRFILETNISSSFPFTTSTLSFHKKAAVRQCYKNKQSESNLLI